MKSLDAREGKARKGVWKGWVMTSSFRVRLAENGEACVDVPRKQVWGLSVYLAHLGVGVRLRYTVQLSTLYFPRLSLLGAIHCIGQWEKEALRPTSWPGPQMGDTRA